MNSWFAGTELVGREVDLIPGLHPRADAEVVESPQQRAGLVERCDNARRGTSRVAGFLVVCVLASVALTACGGSRSPAVANLGAIAATTASASSGRPLDQFAACMRSHGVSQFPDPTTNGTNVKILIGGSGIDPATDPQFRSAQSDCRALLPAGSSGPAITSADRLDYVKAVACVRAHGVLNFPDPTYVNGEPTFHIPATISPSSPVVAKAIATCRKLIPAGLPYSN